MNMREICAKSAAEMQEICTRSDEDMTDIRRKPLGYYAKQRLEDARDVVCWIQKEVRTLNRMSIESSGRQSLFEILDKTFAALEIIDDVLQLPEDKEQG